MKKFKDQDKEKAIEMYEKGISADEIFKRLFPETDISKYQKDYASKTISVWRRRSVETVTSKTIKLRELQKELKRFEAKVALMEKESVLFPLLRKEIKLKRIKEKKFKIVDEVKKENNYLSLKSLLNFYSLSYSGYYKYLKEKESRKEKDQNLFQQINLIFEKYNGKKGYRQISMILGLNHKQAHRIMKKYGLKAKIRRINKSRVTLKTNKENMFVKNILNREFKQKTPYTFASTDITYLKHQNRFSFLSVTKDLASGEILSWSLSKKMNLELVMKSVDKLKVYFKKNNLNLNNLLLHSDQGFQYTNFKYHKKLKELKITQSMSRRGNSVDNAPIESFFGHMKDEIEYSSLNFNQLNNLINNYMLRYNQQRKQWNRKKMTPIEYRNFLLNFAHKS